MLPFPVSVETTSPLISTEDTNYDFTDSQVQMITDFAAGFAGASLAGSLFIIVSYISFPRLRSFAFELILMVSISDFLRACSYVLSAPLDNSLCYPQAALMTFSEVASILWVGSIAFTIHRIFIWDECLSINTTHHERYHLFCWGMAIVLMVLPFITKDYEKDDPLWCWITFDTTSGVALALVCYYIPVWLVLCYLMFVYHKVWWVLKSEPIVRQNSGKPKHQLVTQTRMAIYPTVFFFTVIFACIDRVYELALHKRNFVLALLHAITINSQGLINSFVYGFTTAVRMEWVACFCPKVNTHGVNDRYIHFEDEKTRKKGETDATESTYSRMSICSDDQIGSYSTQNVNYVAYSN
jgi:hypothetical protein